MAAEKENEIYKLLPKTAGLIILTSIVLFILTGLPNSVLAGYIHGVIYYYVKKTGLEDAEFTEEEKK